MEVPAPCEKPPQTEGMVESLSSTPLMTKKSLRCVADEGKKQGKST